jgi:hypothetical protein
MSLRWGGRPLNVLAVFGSAAAGPELQKLEHANAEQNSKVRCLLRSYSNVTLTRFFSVLYEDGLKWNRCLCKSAPK